MSSQIAVVVDFEAFRGGIFKELAIVTPYYSACVIFKAPNSFQELSASDKRQNTWLSQNYHKIDWRSGHIPYDQLKSTAGSFTLKNGIYFGKGKQKCSALSTLFGIHFNDLEDFGCPSLDDLFSIMMDSNIVRHVQQFTQQTSDTVLILKL